MKKYYTLFSTARMLIWSVFITILIPILLVATSNSIYLLEWNLTTLNPTPLTMSLIVDTINTSFSCVVLFISANVLWFSSIYIKEDKFTVRFTVLVLLFILSINLLIFLPHLIILLLGWDGLGLVSFILVIYYQNPASIAAAIITALTNRIGDVAILLSITLTLNQGHWYIINMYPTTWLIPQSILITVAAITKSAQMPFSRWLPAAIAAPTPVSALVHSSTLVTAGVFLLIRFYPILHIWPLFNIFMIIVATTTTFIAGISANTECDFKKIVALSTLSQLGVIIFSLGLNIPMLAYFHILTHALFKALLFICVGTFINYHSHTQDLRWMGNLSQQIPTVISCIIVANIALSGFPFLAGFYSKDLIIENILTTNFRLTIIVITIFSLGLTRFYSTRATVVAIIGPKLNLAIRHLNEPAPIIKSITLLTSSAIIIGATITWISPQLIILTSILPTIIKTMPLVVITTGILFAWIQTTKFKKTPALLTNIPLFNFIRCIIWFIVPLSTQFTIKTPLKTTHYLIKQVDQGWLDKFSGQGMNEALIINSNKLIHNTPTLINAYLLTAVISVIIFTQL